MEATTIYMPLLDEGTDCWRPVLAQPVAGDTFRIVADQSYDSDDEYWRFPPDSLVRCREHTFSDGERHLTAFELVQTSMPST